MSPEERLRLQARSNKTVTIAFLFGIVANVIVGGATDLVHLVSGVLLFAGSTALFVWGCADLARSKGYPWQLGLLGIAWLVGYAVLHFMTDRWLQAKYTPKPPVAHSDSLPDQQF